MTSGESRHLAGGEPLGIGRAGETRGWRDAGAIAAAGALLWWLCRFHASWVPFWAPWDFSWLWYGGYALMLWSYARGLRRVATAPWRIALFLIGMAAVWAVIQTRFEYLAQHMFFYNRIQHVTMHHLGPFLIAAAWPWPVLAAGAPDWLKRVVAHRAFDAGLRFFQRPDVACVVFVGLIALWLFPPVHFVAMIDPRLYAVMNWSMVVDGVLFWSVALDPRPREAAHNSFAARIFMNVVIVPPQIAIGAAIAFADHDIYRFYAWCGRLYPTVDALSDQRIGGLIVWIPPAMMSVIGMLIALNLMRIDEERNGGGGGGGISSSSWTGR
ncbi:MAG TPA: cytochrome c oxidase assembly protein [Sphingomonas sp.]|nr:cytochrome c oxidase assembly protein [Sphingomonas sp.]